MNQAFSRVSGRKARYLGLDPMFTLEPGTFSLETRDQRRCRWNLMSFDVDFSPLKLLWSHWTVTLGLGEAVHPVQLEVRRFGFDFQPCASQSATHFQVTSLRRVTFCLCFSISAQGLLWAWRPTGKRSLFQLGAWLAESTCPSGLSYTYAFGWTLLPLLEISRENGQWIDKNENPF